MKNRNSHQMHVNVLVDLNNTQAGHSRVIRKAGNKKPAKDAGLSGDWATGDKLSQQRLNNQ